MNNRPTDKEIFDTLSAIIGEALLIDRSKIEMESKIFLDLDAESIDILDIRFRIEHAFGFKIDQDELIRSLGEGLTDREIEQKFTVASLVNYIKGRLHQQVYP